MVLAVLGSVLLLLGAVAAVTGHLLVAGFAIATTVFLPLDTTAVLLTPVLVVVAPGFAGH